MSSDSETKTSTYNSIVGFPGGSAGKESASNAGDLPGLDPWVGKIPRRREWLATPILFWPVKNSMDCMSMASQSIGPN